MSEIDFSSSLSKLSLHSPGSQSEDWDNSFIFSDTEPHSLSDSQSQQQQLGFTTPRNSIIFPLNDETTPTHNTSSSSTKTPWVVREEKIRNDGDATGSAKRSLSALLKLHAQKGTDCRFSVEEAARIADVLGQWINTASSPYEGEDDFFARSQDDLSLLSKRSQILHEGRPRGRSESADSRPPSSAGSTKP